MTKRKWLLVALALVCIVLLLTLERDRIFQPQDRSWQTIQERGVWRVGLDPSFPPFEDLDANGNPIGYDVDLAQEIADEWGVQAEIVTIGFDSLLDALQAGQIDSVVSALPYDERMTKDVAYSMPYFEAGIRLVVRTDSALTSAEQLTNQTVAVEWGSMGDMIGRRLQREQAALQLAPYSTPQEAVEALINDQTIDALLVDQVTVRTAQGNGAPIQAVGPALESNPYVIAMPHAAVTLQEKVASTLRTLQETGVMTKIESQWFDHSK